MIVGMTRSGSAAANGIAPSVMKLAPSSQPALPFSRSDVEQARTETVARARAIGGTMPASITAAMIFSSGVRGRVPRPHTVAAKL